MDSYKYSVFFTVNAAHDKNLILDAPMRLYGIISCLL